MLYNWILLIAGFIIVMSPVIVLMAIIIRELMIFRDDLREFCRRSILVSPILATVSALFAILSDRRGLAQSNIGGGLAVLGIVIIIMADWVLFFIYLAIKGRKDLFSRMQVL